MSDKSRPAHAGQPMFTPIRHPLLKRPDAQATMKFFRERNQYIQHVEEANQSGASIQPVSLLASIDADLLTGMIMLNLFPGITKLGELTNEHLQTWLDKTELDYRLPISPDHITSEVKRHVRIAYTDPNPKSRIKSLFIDYITFMRSQSSEFVFEEDLKLAINHVCLLIRPKTLQKHITTRLALEKQKLYKDWAGFFEFVSERACTYEAFHPLAAGGHQNCPECERRKEIVLPSTCSKPRDQKQKPTVNGTNNIAEDKHNSIKIETKSQEEEKKNETDCLNEKCNGKHLLKDCTSTSESEKKLIYRAQYAKSSEKPTLSSIQAQHRHVSDGKFTGLLEDCVNVIINGDYGADISGISESHIKACEQNGMFIPTRTLGEPIEVELALTDPENPQRYSSEKKARISVTLHLPIGPFRLRNVEFLVFKESLPQVILSRPLLQSLGFNLTQHLALVRNKFHDLDYSHIGYSSLSSDQIAPTGLSAILLNTSGSQQNPFPFPHEEYESTHRDEQIKNHRCPTNENPKQCYSVATVNNFYDDNVSDDPIILTTESEIGVDDPSETATELDQWIEEAIRNGLPPHLHPHLKLLVTNHADIFRTKLGHDPAAAVPPLNIRLVENAQPVRVKCRNYTPPQKEFLTAKVDELLSLNLIRRNNQSRWACAPLIVPKKGPEKFRFTVDLRPLDMQTTVHAWPMPHLESIPPQIANDTCFATVDLCHCFWQFHVSTESQELQSFVSPDGVFTPLRVLHGLTNAVAHVQSTVSTICLPIRERVLQWIDDMLMHCQTPDQLLNILEEFFQLCRKHNLKLHAKKCCFFLREVTWCGRIISQEGIKLDPSRISALTNMPPPANAAQLQQFVCAANWMRMAIPQFNDSIEPLHKFLEEGYGISGKRTRRSLQTIPLDSTSWNDTHVQVYKNVKHAISNAVTLVHPCSTKQICLFTDASDYHWAAILT